jgi:hypothetical protein
MTAKLLTYILLVSILSVGCSRRWSRHETIEGFVWKREYFKTHKSNVEFIDVKCNLKKSEITNKGIVADYLFFEFDSVRLYIKQSDTLFMQLIQAGLIQGHYFFSPDKVTMCQPNKWENPTKSVHHNWLGYNFYLERINEIKTIKYPRKIKNELDLYKVYKFAFTYIGQPYINPDVFKIEIKNKEYKCNQDSILFMDFIEKAEIVRFYMSGVEI